MSAKRLWLVRLGKFGEDEASALATGIVTIDFRVEAAANLSTREGCLAAVQAINPEEGDRSVRNWAAQLNQFWNQIQAGDLIVIPLKSGGRSIAIGRVDGRPFSAKDGRPSRNVLWLRTDTPRNAFRQDLLYSFGAFMTVCEIRRNDALARTEIVAAGRNDPGWSAGPPSVSRFRQADDEGESSSDVDEVDLELLAKDGIERQIASSFSGHGLTALIAEVLKAQGFNVRVSPPGPDSGVDIVAGRGGLGFDGPRVVVQVKSGDTPTDAPTLQSLIGCVQDAHADQGLLVSWGGFKPTVLRRANELFFRVRLWGREEIIEAVLEAYSALPETTRTKLPLRRVWMLVPSSEGPDS